MDKKKSLVFKKTRRPSSQKSEYDIDCVFTLHLSPLTQKLVNCVAGINVTFEKPWKYVDKQHILDNLELHSESSEFLPIQDKILEYKESNILFGYKYDFETQKDLFRIVCSKEAEEKVLEINDKKKRILDEKLAKCLTRSAGKWNDLGSEKEIYELIVHNDRPLYHYEIKMSYRFKRECQFSLRNVEDAKDGYVELFDNRNTYNNVYKKRNDASVQVKEKKDSYSQTIMAMKTNMSSQTIPEFKPQLKENLDEKIHRLINKNLRKFQEIFLINENINPFYNDYAELGKNWDSNNWGYLTKYELYKTYVANDKYKKTEVNCVTVSPFIRGLMLASYNTSISSNDRDEDYVAAHTFSKIPMVLWEQDNELKPCLMFDSFKLITIIKFSVYNLNFVAGGSIGGEVCVWDLTDIIDEINKINPISKNLSKHERNMYKYLSWTNYSKEPNAIEPAIKSRNGDGHNDRVIDIMWVSY